MIKKSIFLFSFVSLLLTTAPALAQIEVTIEQLQKNPSFSISGEIVTVIGNKFVLDDGTGQIIVDAGPSWYHQININSGETVTVIGKYVAEDFAAFTIIKSDGQVIEIRPAGGPPPWAGGHRRR